MIVQYFFSKYTFISDYRKENCSMPLDDLDVHYLDYNEDSIHYVLSCFESRNRGNKERWLLYAHNKPLSSVLDVLAKGNLDLDDDVMVALQNENTVELWEVYKISAEYNVESHQVGAWSKDEGLKMTPDPKWYRRGNLKVRRISILNKCRVLKNGVHMNDVQNDVHKP